MCEDFFFFDSEVFSRLFPSAALPYSFSGAPFDRAFCGAAMTGRRHITCAVCRGSRLRDAVPRYHLSPETASAPACVPRGSQPPAPQPQRARAPPLAALALIALGHVGHTHHRTLKRFRPSLNESATSPCRRGAAMARLERVSVDLVPGRAAGVCQLRCYEDACYNNVRRCGRSS